MELFKRLQVETPGSSTTPNR